MSPDVQLIRVSPDGLAGSLPFPAVAANKYTRGKLTVIGGSSAYPGSACLASKAALLMGAGYVECVCSAQAVPLVRAFAPSLVVRRWDEVSVADLALGESGAQHPKACTLGSGMEVDGEQRIIAERIIDQCAQSLVMDGGALRMAAECEWRDHVRARAEQDWITIMTPHGGEAAALAKAAEVAVAAETACMEDQARYAQRLADAYQATILLKGPVSFIASPAYRGSERCACVHMMDEGTPALAKAGTGDVLAGMVGALAAQGIEAHIACSLASFLHARAGCISEERVGIISVTAESVLEALPASISSLARSVR